MLIRFHWHGNLFFEDSMEEGGVLIFVPGWQEITDTIKALEKCPNKRTRWRIFPLHSMIPPHEQNRIFDPVASGERKVIVSTNLAETSITVEDIVYVSIVPYKTFFLFLPQKLDKNGFGITLRKSNLFRF